MKKKKASTDSFVLTLHIKYTDRQRRTLDTIFDCCKNVYNELTRYELDQLNQLQRTRKWKDVQAQLAALYKELDKKSAPTEEQQAKLDKLYKRRNELLSNAGFSEFSFQSRVKRYSNHYSKYVGSDVAQKIATSVWQMFESYLFGNGKTISFMKWTEFLSIEGKKSTANIVYHPGEVSVAKMVLPVVFPMAKKTRYEEEALKCRIKYCRIIRIPWKNGKWLYMLQLILEGKPPVKKKDNSDKERFSLGRGRVGLDIGPQTLAAVGNRRISMNELAPSANMPNAELRRINRAMDRSRRATNPEFFNEDGTVIHIDKLPPELLSNGKRKWKESNGYKRLAGNRRYLYAKLARTRRIEHNRLANQLLCYGNIFYIETMRFSALAKKAKKKEVKEGEKPKRRKRFGKSIANKAPATFVKILEKKVLSQGGKFYHIKTWAAKASQFRHWDKTYKPKKLSQRWNKLPDGHKVQRDLYSAFLLMCTNSTLDGFIQKLCDSRFDKFLVLHDKEVERLSTISTPSSTGVKGTAA